MRGGRTKKASLGNGPRCGCGAHSDVKRGALELQEAGGGGGGAPLAVEFESAVSLQPACAVAELDVLSGPKGIRE